MKHRLDMSRGAFQAAVFLFCLSLLIGGANLLFTAREVNAVRTVTATAARNAASVNQLCQAGNTARAQQVSLWDHVLTIARGPRHETPAAHRRRLATERAFENYVHKVFAPRDCSHPLTIH